MRNLVSNNSFIFKSTLTDAQIAQLVREKYSAILDICAKKAKKDGPDWRKDNNPSGVASNAQLWILGACLGHASVNETDAELGMAILREGA